MSLARLRSALPRPYAPRIDAFTQRFWDALADNEFLLASCGDCAALEFPPRPQCARCGSGAIDWQPASGDGVLYTSTRVHAAAGPFACRAPYSVGIVDLTEGVRILTRLMHDASSLPPGSPVRLAVLEHTDGPLFVAVSAG